MSGGQETLRVFSAHREKKAEQVSANSKETKVTGERKRLWGKGEEIQ